MNLQKYLTDWATNAFEASATEPIPAEVDLRVLPAQDPKFGDYQCNACMALAKHFKKAPRQIAEQFVATSDLPPGVASLEVAGPGFINIHLDLEWLTTQASAQALDPSLGVQKNGTGKTVVLDYSSPNVAKSMHIGHIRSTVIGNCLDRLLRCLGYEVISDNHIGDWGTQFGLLLLGYKTFRNHEAFTQNPLAELERIYIKANEQDESWREQAKQELVKLQQGDEENNALWQQFIQVSLNAFDKLYQRLGVSFDLTRGESYYNSQLPKVLQQLKDTGLLEESEGAQVVNLEKEKRGVCIVQKRDGGYNYATTDIATVLDRHQEFSPYEIIYVTDERQQLHFNQLFTVIKKLGVPVRLKHIWFGLMRLPEATFSTRQGNVIKLEALLDEAESRALNLVQKSSPEMTEEQQHDVARMVGIGAVKYADLSQNPQSLVVFSWDKAMALDGNSAPYLQYAHARICSVLDKYASQFPEHQLEDYPMTLTEPVERELALKALRFPEAVNAAAENYRPNILCDYLFELAQNYSRYYQQVPFLKAEPGVRESRLQLCRLTSLILKKGLDLLGIEAPERI